MQLPFLVDDAIILSQTTHMDDRSRIKVFDSYFDLIVESAIHITLCITFNYIQKIIFPMNADYLFETCILKPSELNMIKRMKQIDSILNQHLQCVPGLKDEIWYYLVFNDVKLIYIMQQEKILCFKRDIKAVAINYNYKWKNDDNNNNAESESIFSMMRENSEKLKSWIDNTSTKVRSFNFVTDFFWTRYEWTGKIVVIIVIQTCNILQNCNVTINRLEPCLRFFVDCLTSGGGDAIGQVVILLLIIPLSFAACIIGFWLLCGVVIFGFARLLPQTIIPLLFYTFGMINGNSQVKKQIVLRYTCSVFAREPICFAAMVVAYLAWFVLDRIAYYYQYKIY